MIKYIINAIKAAKEQNRLQNRLNVLLCIPKHESVKLRVPKRYIELFETLAIYGVKDAKQLESYLKTPVLFRIQHYDICEFYAVLEQDTARISESDLRKEAIYKLLSYLTDYTEAIKVENEQRISPYHHRRKYSIKVAIERK